MGGDTYVFSLIYGVRGYINDGKPLLINEDIPYSKDYYDMFEKINETIDNKYGLSFGVYIISEEVYSRWEGQGASDVGTNNIIVGWRCPEFKTASELVIWEQNLKKSELEFVSKSMTLRDIESEAKYHNVYIWHC